MQESLNHKTYFRLSDNNYVVLQQKFLVPDCLTLCLPQ